MEQELTWYLPMPISCIALFKILALAWYTGSKAPSSYKSGIIVDVGEIAPISGDGDELSSRSFPGDLVDDSLELIGMILKSL